MQRIFNKKRFNLDEKIQYCYRELKQMIELIEKQESANHSGKVIYIPNLNKSVSLKDAKDFTNLCTRKLDELEALLQPDAKIHFSITPDELFSTSHHNVGTNGEGYASI